MSEDALPPLRRPAQALAWSEARLAGVTPGPPGLALWLPEGETVALGVSQSVEREVDAAAIRRDGVEVVRRQSGGGAVLLYDGVLCWEAWAMAEDIAARSGEGGGIRAAYAVLSTPVIRALRSLGIDACQAGICDVSARRGSWPRPRKLAGTAQLRRREAVLVHGVLLVTADVGRLAEYLHFPGDQPEYRDNRSHRDFCVSAGELLPESASGELMRGVAAGIRREALGAGWALETIPEVLEGEAGRLEQEKYRSRAWNFDKSRQR